MLIDEPVINLAHNFYGSLRTVLYIGWLVFPIIPIYVAASRETVISCIFGMAFCSDTSESISRYDRSYKY